MRRNKLAPSKRERNTPDAHDGLHSMNDKRARKNFFFDY